MEENNLVYKKNYPYIILVIVIASTALILVDIWTNASDLFLPDVVTLYELIKPQILEFLQRLGIGIEQAQDSSVILPNQFYII